MASLRVLQRVNAGVSFRVPFRDVAGPSKQRCASTSSAASSRSSYIERFNARLPRFLQKITRPLTSAPVTHVTAFLVLHEITAIAPIFGLAGLFHYTQWMPPYISEWKWFADGMRKWGNYLRKRGWLKEDEPSKRSWWTRGETGTRLVAEFAAAWAITKLLLPVRLIVCVWATPLFARLFVAPPMRFFGYMFRRPKVAAAPTQALAAGTNAVGGGAIPRIK